jgi:N-acetyl-alpha-D-muramate 1-phosphate uridylyltransferase
MKRQVVILAGGLGTRLRPITESVPKPLVPVGGKPYLHWQLEELAKLGYSRILLLVGYLGEMIVEEFGDGRSLGLEIQYSHERYPLGTGGALKYAKEMLEDEFILLNGDSFLRIPLEEMESMFKGFSALMAVCDASSDVPVIPNVKTQDGVVVSYEKDAEAERGFTQIDAGVYVLRKSLLMSASMEKFMVADLWPNLIRQKTLGAFKVSNRFYDIGTPDRLVEFEAAIPQLFKQS